MGALQTAEDLARVFIHSAAMGIPELAQRTFGDAKVANQTDKQVAQSRANTGFAGDLANAAGYIAPGIAALKGLKALPMLPGAIRAAPAAIPEAVQAARAGLADLGGPGLTKAEAAARLGIPYVPTIAEQALNATGRAIANTAALPFEHPWLTAGTVAAALGGYASRNNANAAPTATPAQQAAAAATPATAQPVGQAASSGSSSASSNLAPPLTPNPTFAQLASMYQAANGGQISLRALGQLAGIAAQTAPAPRYAPVTPQSIAAGRALSLSDQIAATQYKAAQSQKDYLDAAQQQYARESEIARSAGYDPLTGMAFPQGQQ